MPVIRIPDPCDDVQILRSRIKGLIHCVEMAEFMMKLIVESQTLEHAKVLAHSYIENNTFVVDRLPD